MGITAREKKLNSGEERLIENLVLVADQLAHAVTDLHRAALELNHAHSDAVEVDHQVRSTLMATAQGHFFGKGEMVGLRVLPIHQMNLIVGRSSGNLHRHPIAQQLVGAHVGLIERDAGGIGSGHELLQRRCDVGFAVAPLQQVRAQQVGLDAAVVFPFAPIAQEVIAEAV